MLDILEYNEYKKTYENDIENIYQQKTNLYMYAMFAVIMGPEYKPGYCEYKNTYEEYQKMNGPLSDEGHELVDFDDMPPKMRESWEELIDNYAEVINTQLQLFK